MSLVSVINGARAEKSAARYLRGQGLKVIATNMRYKCGEIDIIAEDKDAHVFVEVKYKSDESRGSATDMVSPAKQAKIVQAAKLWLQSNDPQFDRSCRFDVIAISASKEKGRAAEIQWLKNAYNAELW